MSTQTWTQTWTQTTLLVCLLSNTLTSALHCDWLKHYGHRSNKCLTALEDMGGQLIENDGPDFSANKLYRRIRNAQVESQVLFIRDSLENLLRLYYHGNRSTVTWDTVSTQKFLECLHSQIDNLNECVSSNRTDSKLMNYYRRLSSRVLNHTRSSVESWEFIRTNTKLHLDQLQLLVNYINYNNNNNNNNNSDNKRQKYTSSRETTITTTM